MLITIELDHHIPDKDDHAYTDLTDIEIIKMIKEGICFNPRLALEKAVFSIDRTIGFNEKEIPNSCNLHKDCRNLTPK